MSKIKDKKKIQKWKNGSQLNTETMIPISEIRWETVVLKDGWLRAVIKVSWLNLDLRNYDEQEVVVEQYKRFLNGLDFPIQVIVRNNFLDLTDYIGYLQKNVDLIENDTLRKQGDTFIGFMEDINLKQWLIYVKEFYVVVPYYPIEDMKKVRRPWYVKFMQVLKWKQTPETIVHNRRIFVKNVKFLDTRTHIIEEWFKAIGMDAHRLDTQDLIELYFSYYNPTLHENLWRMAV